MLRNSLVRSQVYAQYVASTLPVRAVAYSESDSLSHNGKHHDDYRVSVVTETQQQHMLHFTDLLMPWEHYVCSKCFQRNPYAIWLVKQQCFQPHRHQNALQILVSIDQNYMVMVTIQPLSGNHVEVKERFISCQFYPNCKNGSLCPFAHSEIEANTWTIKQRMIKANPVLMKQVELYCKATTCTSSEVCQVCAESNPSAVWLAGLKCIHPEEHCDHPTVTVVCSSWKGLVRVRQLPSSITELEKVTRSKDIVRNSWAYTCSHGDECTTAHTEEEVAFWRWQIIKKLYAQLDREFVTLCAKYEYPGETSAALLRGVQCTLTRENYVSKYHKLVYLDELAHCRKMIKECNGPVYIQAPTEGQLAHLKGINSVAMDYAFHNHAEVTISIDNHTYHATVIDRKYEQDTLVIKVHSFHFLQTYVGQYLENATAHFDVNHLFYKRLHEAITYANSKVVVKKLLPEKEVFTSSKKKIRLELPMNFSIDSEYQRAALSQMLSCNPGAPCLVLGPFGTGKTHILAAAIGKLLEDPSNKLLVCTHLNRCADGLYKTLQKHIGKRQTLSQVVRLVPNEEGLLHVRIPEPYSYRVANNDTVNDINYWPAIVTTFITALHLKEMAAGQGMVFNFTHILIDEGAQSREPETLGALVMAESSTRIVVVGDNQQVGPQVEVLSKTARENGLGTSLLERLYNHYKGTNAIQTHTATLLTNYRCHPSILTLASSLLYEGSLLSQSDSKTHPKAPFPLVFACSSLDHEKGSFRDLPSENEMEAEMLVLKMLEFIREWPSELTKSCNKSTIGLLASTKQQVSCLRKKYRQLKPPTELPCDVEIITTYNIQGEEFAAVFLSTAEPTDKYGMPRNVTKSICNGYIFNTIITRARSLVYIAGNPFLLRHMSTNFKVKCWQEYIQRCIQCQSFLSETIPTTHIKHLPEAMEQLVSMETVKQATAVDLKESDVDIIVERYIADLHRRKEYQKSHNLVQDHSGIIQWVEEEESDHFTEEKGVVWCTLECKTYRTATAIPIDPSKPPIKIETLNGRRLAFHGDVVKVDTIKQCVLLDDETEEAISKTHFGTSFLCRVDPKNPILFYPLDKRHPKFVNLPTITYKEKCGVVCFDPKSINSNVKIKNFIPLETATKMLFIVKFLGWNKKYPFPLGIIVGAMPPGYSIGTGDMVLRITNNIYLQRPQMPPDHPQLLPPNMTSTVFRDAFTIDPKGSRDHDDALTCKLLQQHEGGRAEYEIGVHITNVQKYVPEWGTVDDDAYERGFSVYCAPDKCVSHMFPKEVVNVTNLTEGQLRDVFSVIARVRINKEVVESVHDCKIMECQMISALELTYSEVQTIICDDPNQDQSLQVKLIQYNRTQHPDSASIEGKVGILWTVAQFLRQERLGTGAGCYLISDPDEELHPEAHSLIQEFMIWANYQVATKLLEVFPNSTILRRQGKPNDGNLQSLLKSRGPDMAVSLALKTYVSSDVSPSDTLYVLKDTVQQIHHYLQGGNVRKALHTIQLEHLHPQTAVGHNQFRRKAQSSAEYCISSSQEKNYWHDSLRCNQYTHFTSPIRRYIDVVVQCLLHAALNHNECPYRRDELEEIIRHVKICSKGAHDYEQDFRKLALASELTQSNREFLCFVTEINKGKLYVYFKDVFLKMLHSEETLIHLKNLNASVIPPQSEIRRPDSPERPNTGKPNEKPPSQVTSGDPKPFTWKAKVTSFTGSPDQFLSNPFLQLTQNATSSRRAEISIFQPDGHGDLKNVHLKEVSLNADVIPFTTAVPLKEWTDIQSCLSTRVDASQALQKLCARNNPPTHRKSSHPKCPLDKAPLWIYKVHRPVESCEVMRVNLSATHYGPILRPCIQLLEVGPGLDICIQHNATPSECFADKLTDNASKKSYRDVYEYFQRWEQVILAEASLGSLTQTELLIVRDVPLKWPELTMQTNSAGQVYYQLIIPKDKKDVGVRMDFPDHFVKSSYDFFRFTEGDLVCVRYGNRGNDTDLKYTFHMVVSDVVRQGRNVLAVYLKFVGNTSNYIPLTIARVLNSGSLQCEIQLIPLTLPFRRIYRSLNQFTFEAGERTTLAEEIALGYAHTEDTNPPRLQAIFSDDEVASIATSLWPLRRRRHGSGRVKLNKYQREAIQLGCSDANRFVMIQGPPGTGKTVTGAHLAYALAMKLYDDDELTPCVMYCGPSQQSVNVVLDILTSPNSPVIQKENLSIIRIYSKAIERKDFPGPKHNTDLFRQEQTSTNCDPKYRDYALHHIIRKRNPNIAALEGLFDRLQQQKKVPSLQKREEYRTIVKKTEVAVLRDGVDIVLCTCNEASSHRVMQSLNPVYCIIDECAMATEPDCMVPIRRAEHVVLIGDHCQLQPVIQYREAAEMGLGQSLFERYVKLVGRHPHVLKEQYRMHEALCEFPSQEFYNGELTTGDSVKNRSDSEAHLISFWPQGAIKPFVFCDIIGKEAVNYTGQEGTARVGLESKYNEKEAKKIVQIAKRLIDTHKVDPKKIAALTPYSAQREEIKKQLERQHVTGIQVKTITESQGSEYGIVLLSTVRSRPITMARGEKEKADLGWLRANLGFITDRHQICVGITRGKYGLVIVGNKTFLSYDRTWNHLIKHYERNGCVKGGVNFP